MKNTINITRLHRKKFEGVCVFLSFVYIFVEKLYEHMEYKYDEESVNA